MGVGNGSRGDGRALREGEVGMVACEGFGVSGVRKGKWGDAGFCDGECTDTRDDILVTFIDFRCGRLVADSPRGSAQS